MIVKILKRQRPGKVDEMTVGMILKNLEGLWMILKDFEDIEEKKTLQG